MPGVGAHFFFFFGIIVYSLNSCVPWGKGSRPPYHFSLYLVLSCLLPGWRYIYIFFFFKESRVFLSVTGIYSCIKLSFFLEEESIKSLALLRHDYNAETISRGHGMLAFLNFNFLFRKFSYRPIPSGKKC